VTASWDAGGASSMPISAELLLLLLLSMVLLLPVSAQMRTSLFLT
jgi:hypothetical protein